MSDTFSKLEALKFGWQALKTHLVFLASLMALILVLNLLPEVGRWQTLEKAPPLALFWTVAGYLIQMATQMGLIRISLKLVDGKQPRYRELFEDLATFGRYLVVNLLFVLLIVAGLLLLVVPGIVWSVKYQFAPFLIVDRHPGIKEAFRKSAEITSDVKMEVFLFFLLVMGINLVGLLAFGIGIFTTLPATMIAYAFVYRKLLERKRLLEAVGAGTEVPAAVS
ncbi:MAG: hypothetical protein HY892_05970 [Deltaproteobacteria bacterium]|nr:hypothetical protein [Deltaproteobacteria bacterium]